MKWSPNPILYTASMDAPQPKCAMGRCVLHKYLVRRCIKINAKEAKRIGLVKCTEFCDAYRKS